MNCGSPSKATVQKTSGLFPCQVQFLRFCPYCWPGLRLGGSRACDAKMPRAASACVREVSRHWEQNAQSVASRLTAFLLKAGDSNQQSQQRALVTGLEFHPAPGRPGTGAVSDCKGAASGGRKGGGQTGLGEGSGDFSKRGRQRHRACPVGSSSWVGHRCCGSH